MLRSGRLDRKIEFPNPNEEARARILQIHSRKMNVSKEVNYEELARCTDDFNGAQLKAVCVEAVSVETLIMKIRLENVSQNHYFYLELIISLFSYNSIMMENTFIYKSLSYMNITWCFLSS